MQTNDSSTINPTAAQTNNPSTINLPQEEYDMFRRWVADTRNRNIKDRLNLMKGKLVAARRQTLVLRRADFDSLAPDEDVVAYHEIYKHKNPSEDPKNKTFVTDNEINAFKLLCPEFDVIPTLAAIMAKVDELKAAGQLSAEGDNVSDDEE